MKREIVCNKCQKELRKLFPSDNPYPGEHVKFLEGAAKIDMLCDHCGIDIPIDSECCALSIWADYGGIFYYPWEEEYLNL